MLSFSGSLKVFVAVEAVRHAQRVQWAARVGDGAAGRRPQAGRACSCSAIGGIRGSKSFALDGTGIWVLTKRLEQGTFSWPKNLEPETTKLKLTPQALAMLTDGVDLRGAKLRPWYERED